MFRRSVRIGLAICLALTLGNGVAMACGDGAKCDVERTCTKTEEGMTCVIKAKGETTVDQVRDCVREHAGDRHKMEGVTVELKDIEGGIEVLMTTDSPDALKALHAHGTGCCTKNEKACDSHAAVHAKDHECGEDCPEDCPHAKAAAAKAKHAEHDCSKGCAKDCPHAQAAAKTEHAKGGCAGHSHD